MTDKTGDGIAMGSIDEASIHTLVHDFYGKAMQDDLLAPIFGREVAADAWPAHLDKMCAFWSSTLLRSGRYDGRPLAPHLRLDDLDDGHFQRWLTLFATAARNAFAADDAAGVIAMAERIAHSFRLARSLHKGRDSLGLVMIRA